MASKDLEPEKTASIDHEPEKAASVTSMDRSPPSQPESNKSIPETQNEVAGSNGTGRNYPTGFKLAILVLGLFLSTFLTALDRTIISTAIPKITDQFGSVNDIGWYGSAYFMTSTALQPIWGRIYKVLDAKKCFLVAIFFFELGSLICGVAPNSNTLIVGRAVAGIGVGGIFSGVLVILSLQVPLQRRPMIFSLFGLVWGLASIVGPLMGGALTDRTTWRWCFYINLPVGAIAVAVVVLYLHLPKSPPSGLSIVQKITQLDLIGVGLLVPAVVCLLLALQWGGNTYPWNNSRIIGLFVGFGVLTILFVGSQILQGEKATFPPRIMKMRTNISLACFNLGFGGGYYMLIYYLPFYFQSVRGDSALKSGVSIIPTLVAQSVFSIVIGAAVTHAGFYTPFLIACTCVFAIGSGLITTFSIGISTGKLVGYQILAGAGVGAGFQIPMTAVQTVLKQQDIPIGSAAVIFFQALGGSIFLSVGQAVLQNGITRSLQENAPDISPQLIFNAGATAIRPALEKIGRLNDFPLVVDAYMSGLTDVFRASLALVVFAALASMFLEWKNVKKVAKAGAASTPATSKA